MKQRKKRAVFENREEAMKHDPRKKGVKLYSVHDGSVGWWVWARTKDEALAAVTEDLGFVAAPHVVGASHDGEYLDPQGPVLGDGV